MRSSPVRCIVEFTDGTERTYEPIGGFVSSPRMSGDGKLSPIVMDLIFQPGEGAPIEHVATIPLINVRQYRLEPIGHG
jgi:hypothetical protein